MIQTPSTLLPSHCLYWPSSLLLSCFEISSLFFKTQATIPSSSIPSNNLLEPKRKKYQAYRSSLQIRPQLETPHILTPSHHQSRSLPRNAEDPSNATTARTLRSPTNFYTSLLLFPNRSTSTTPIAPTTSISTMHTLPNCETHWRL